MRLHWLTLSTWKVALSLSGQLLLILQSSLEWIFQFIKFITILHFFVFPAWWYIVGDQFYLFLYITLEKEMAPHSSTLAWKIPWAEEPGRLQSMGSAKSRTRLSDFTFTFHFPALEKEMATHSRILAWRIPGREDPGGLPPMGSHRFGHNWSDLAAATAATSLNLVITRTENLAYHRKSVNMTNNA